MKSRPVFVALAIFLVLLSLITMFGSSSRREGLDTSAPTKLICPPNKFTDYNGCHACSDFNNKGKNKCETDTNARKQNCKYQGNACLCKNKRLNGTCIYK